MEGLSGRLPRSCAVEEHKEHGALGQRQHKLQQGDLESQGHTMAIIKPSEGQRAWTPWPGATFIVAGLAGSKRHILPVTETLEGAGSTYPLARGDMICGWSMRKAGLRQRLSRYSPTNLSSSRAVDCGGGQSTLFSLHCSQHAQLNNCFYLHSCAPNTSLHPPGLAHSDLLTLQRFCRLAHIALQEGTLRTVQRMDTRIASPWSEGLCSLICQMYAIHCCHAGRLRGRQTSLRKYWRASSVCRASLEGH